MQAAEHQVNFQASYKNPGSVGIAVELFFQTKQQARAEQSFQGDVIGVLGRRFQTFALAQSEAGAPWHGRVSNRITGRHVAKFLQSGRTLCKSRSPISVFGSVRTGICQIFFPGGVGLLDQIAVAIVAGEPCGQQSRRDQPDQRKSRRLDDHSPSDRGAVGRNPCSFADDHFQNEVVKKVALAVP